MNTTETALVTAARAIAHHNSVARMTSRQAALEVMAGETAHDKVRELVDAIRTHVASLDGVNGAALKRSLDTLALCDRILAHVDAWQEHSAVADMLTPTDETPYVDTPAYQRDAAMLDVQTSLMALAQLAPKTVRGNEAATEILRALLSIASGMRHVAVQVLPTSLDSATITQVQARIAEAEAKAALRRARLNDVARATALAIGPASVDDK